MTNPKHITDTPEWERHIRRLHALGRVNEQIGQELVRASGKRTDDPEFRDWLQELATKTKELLDRDRGQFLAFSETYDKGVE